MSRQRSHRSSPECHESPPLRRSGPVGRPRSEKPCHHHDRACMRLTAPIAPQPSSTTKGLTLNIFSRMACLSVADLAAANRPHSFFTLRAPCPTTSDFPIPFHASHDDSDKLGCADDSDRRGRRTLRRRDFSRPTSLVGYDPELPKSMQSPSGAGFETCVRNYRPTPAGRGWFRPAAAVGVERWHTGTLVF